MGLIGGYKAMLVYDDKSRTISNDWVLKANTEYFNIKGNSIGTTNESAIFTNDLKDYIYAESAATYKRVWTGMSKDWETIGHSCDSWGEDPLNSTRQGRYGASNSLNIQEVISKSEDYCRDKSWDYLNNGSKAHLYCVKQ